MHVDEETIKQHSSGGELVALIFAETICFYYSYFCVILYAVN